MSINISATDIVAYLGAAAWIPQIVKWLYNLYTRPIITITPEKSASVGYTMFGPIFNLRLSINVDKKGILSNSTGNRSYFDHGAFKIGLERCLIKFAREGISFFPLSLSQKY